MVATIVDNPRAYAMVLASLNPARHYLVGPLSATFQDPKAKYQALRADILSHYASDQPERMAGLLADALDPASFKKLFQSLVSGGGRPVDVLTEQLDRSSSSGSIEAAALRKANVAVALLKLEVPDRVWPLLKPVADPRMRSYLIDRLSVLDVEPQTLVDRLRIEDDEGISQALILAIGECGQKLPEPKRRQFMEELEATHRDTNTDPGVHSATEWILRAWVGRDRVAKIDESLKSSGGELAGRRWFVNSQGQTMVVVSGPRSFQVGSHKFEPADNLGKREPLRDVTIEYTYAIASHEVTVAQFRQFRPNHVFGVAQLTHDGKVDTHCPANKVTWYDAVAYCNWLSKQEDIPEDQWCYLPNSELEFAAGMKLAPDHLSLSGYRLPIEVEWEYACRAGTTTSRYYGESDELLPQYVWFQLNSARKLWPVGSLKPNTLGLFDTLGNALEWCEDAHHPQDHGTHKPDDSVVRDDVMRVMRGEKELSLPENIRVAHRELEKLPNNPDFIFGFRVVRTFPR